MAASGFSFVANLACLDFVNTEPMREGTRVDLLGEFTDLVRWLREAGLLSEEAGRRALARWQGTAEARAALAEAKALRGALRAGVERLVAGRAVGAGMIRAVNRVLAARPNYRRLVREGQGYGTKSVAVEESAVGLLAPVAESAAWLLERGDPSLVRRCGGPACVLFFYDTTKNRSRRWCSMEGCGSRAKAVAYYRRRHPPA